MKLRHAAWVALSGALLVVPPAVATPTGSSSEPSLQAAAEPEAGLPQAAPLPASSNDVAVVPTMVSPGEADGETAAEQPQVDDGEDAAPVMPAAIHMPLPQINPFKPEVTLKVVIDL